MTKKLKRASAPEGKLSPVNPFTRHLAGGAPLIDMSQFERSSTVARRQTAAVSRDLEQGQNLTGTETRTRSSRPYFAPVVGRDGSQPDNDRRQGNRLASI